MLNTKRLKVLLVMEQCNPEWASVPLVAYNFYQGLRQLADITLITHERNQKALERVREGHRIVYIKEKPWISQYYALVSKLTARGGVNWPLQHALTYPIYAQFNRSVYTQFSKQVESGFYDLVHAMTPILPRYPVQLIQACKQTPFVLGPVNGGIPFPQGFRSVAKKEFVHFNVLRMFTRLLPGYGRTYRLADRVLAASRFTLNMVQETFGLSSDQVELFHENGIFFKKVPPKASKKSKGLRLVFVGRLVPYKGADMAVEALARLPQEIAAQVQLTIVGDGPEREHVEKMVAQYGLQDKVSFTGWVDQAETIFYYQQADVFCFPSIREFGGAVALEAMACGLPCIVPDYAGLGEYVTDETGFKIEAKSREYLIAEMASKIVLLFEDEKLLDRMSKKALERVQEYDWGEKAQRMLRVYHSLTAKQE